MGCRHGVEECGGAGDGVGLGVGDAVELLEDGAGGAEAVWAAAELDRAWPTSARSQRTRPEPLPPPFRRPAAAHQPGERAKKSSAIPMVACALLAPSLAGCSLSKPYPAKQLYVLDPGAPQQSGGTLRVPRVRVTEPLSRTAFQSLVAPSRLEEDYYSTFAAEPDRLITSELMEWLSTAGHYEAVVDGASTADASHTLQCTISELYCDRTDPAAPRAVLSARSILLDETSVPARVISARDYEAVEPLRGSEADAFAEALGAALKRLLGRLSADVARVAEPPCPGEA